MYAGTQAANNFPGVTNEQLNTAIVNISTRQYDISNMNEEGIPVFEGYLVTVSLFFR
jgi:outer membrane receptor for ferric coprogen and ferric-rhodotorulic acid